MKPQTLNHPKTMRLARELGIDRCSALGIIGAIWCFASEYAPDGDLSNYQPDDIAAAIGYGGDAQRMMDACRASKFIDTAPGDDCDHPSSAIIHDWHEHCPDFIHRRLARANKLFASGESARVSRLSEDEKNSYKPAGRKKLPSVRPLTVRRAEKVAQRTPVDCMPGGKSCPAYAPSPSPSTSSSSEKDPQSTPPTSPQSGVTARGDSQNSDFDIDWESESYIQAETPETAPSVNHTALSARCPSQEAQKKENLLKRKKVAVPAILVESAQTAKKPTPPQPNVRCSNDVSYPPEFVNFVALFPEVRQLKIPIAFQCWRQIAPDSELLLTLMSDVCTRLTQDFDWTRDNGRYVQNPAGYLEQRIWEKPIRKTPVISGVKNLINGSSFPPPKKTSCPTPRTDLTAWPDCPAWKTAVENLAETMDAESFDTWISRITPYSSTDGSLILDVPSLFFRNFLISSCGDAVVDALELNSIDELLSILSIAESESEEALA
jgi:hypothetical protein